MPRQTNEHEFQIGLTMSGAISAGAYTAGVFDFLILALDEWEKAGEGRIPGVNPAEIPNHRVGIKVLSGASAGALTAAIGAIALGDADQHPIDFRSDEAGKGLKVYLPKLYEAWVVKPGLIAEDGQKNDFLTNSDLAGPPTPEDDYTRTSGVSRPAPGDPQPVTSLLNARLLDEIAKAGIDVKQVGKERPYIAKTLHIYMTLSNLRGVPYKVSFDGGDYHMISHGDRVHYAVTGLGNWDSPSIFADNDKPRSIAAAELVGAPAGRQKWKDYSICALASAAFPVGLAPRQIGAVLGDNPAFDEYQGRHFPIDSLINEHGIDPDWTKAVREAPAFWFTTADGGIIDNDPFEYARFSIKANPSEPNESDLAAADRAVIMVSPFPERKPIKSQDQPELGIASIFSALMPALIDQARFKPSELVLAADPTCGSRYLIGPSRVTIVETRDANGKIERREVDERYAIASGLLGGFGGFVARAFRDHDYQLGRRNCQRFLRHIFTLPPKHPMFQSWPPEAKINPVFEAKPTKTMGTGYSVIPLFGAAREEVALPAWPRISQDRFETLQERIEKRFDYVAPALLAQNVKDPLRTLLGLAVRPFPYGIGLIRDNVLKFAQSTILADLVRRDQIEGWELPQADGLSDCEIRLVLAELIDPAYDLRNVSGLAKSTNLTEDKVKTALALGQSQAAKGKPFEVWQAPWTDKAGGSLYALASRKPPRLRRILGPNHTGPWFTKLRVDAPGF